MLRRLGISLDASGIDAELGLPLHTTRSHITSELAVGPAFRVIQVG